MRKIRFFTLVIFLFLCGHSIAQVSGYNVSEGNLTYTRLNGSPVAFTTGYMHSDGIPIGFNFRFGDKVYTHFSLGASGVIKLGNADVALSSNYWIYSLGVGNSNTPLIAPLWQYFDPKNGEVSYYSYARETEKVLVVDWYNVRMGDASNSIISFKIILHEVTGVIEFIYEKFYYDMSIFTCQAGLDEGSSFLNLVDGTSLSFSNTNNTSFHNVPKLSGKHFILTPECLNTSVPSITNLTSTSVTMNWPAVKWASGYEVCITQDDISPVVASKIVVTPFDTETGLLPNSVYYFFVRTLCGGNQCKAKEWSKRTIITPCRTQDGCCPDVKGLKITSLSSTDASITWDKVEGAPGYEFSMGTSPQPPSHGFWWESNSYHATSLTPGSTYYFYVRTACNTTGTSYSSNWSIIPVNTICAAQNLPYTEDFESPAAPGSFLPGCITSYSADSLMEWRLESGNAHTGNGSARLRTIYGIGNDDWLFTRKVNVEADVPYRLTFWMKGGQETSAKTISVWYGAEASPAIVNQYNDIATAYIPAPATYQKISMLFKPLLSGPIVIGFHCSFPPNYPFDVNAESVYIDDISLTNAPCTTPSGLTVSDITSQSAKISWTASIPSIKSYQYSVSTSGELPTTPLTSNQPYASVSALKDATHYYVFLRTECWTGVYSDWIIDSFATPLDCNKTVALKIVDGTNTATELSGAGVYNLMNCGSASQGKEILYRFIPDEADSMTLNIKKSNGRYIRYAYRPEATGCGSEGWTCISTQNNVGSTSFGPLAAGVPYLLLADALDSSGSSTAAFSIDYMPAPAHDDVCNAVTLIQGNSAVCYNTLRATYVNEPTLAGGCGIATNTLWYKFTPSYSGEFKVTINTVTNSSAGLKGSIYWFTASGTCPTMSLSAIPNFACQPFSQTGPTATDVVTSPLLVAGTTYYLLVNTSSVEPGNVCISVNPPQPCSTPLNPVPGSTSIDPTNGITLAWTSSANASSYELHYRSDNTQWSVTTLSSTSTTISNLSYNATYYWYVIPKGTGSAPYNCEANLGTFSTMRPSNCTPTYVAGCMPDYTITKFTLQGITNSSISNESGATCTSVTGYNDYRKSIATVELAPGTYTGVLRTGSANNFISIWIDSNDNGQFETTEQVVNNLQAGITDQSYSINIPATTPAGTHTMRVMTVMYDIPPTEATMPCGIYLLGETEDYQVHIGTTTASRTANTTNTVAVNLKTTTSNPASTTANTVTGINTKANKLLLKKLYPNPAISTIRISIGSQSKENVSIGIADITGRIITTKAVTLETGSNDIDFNVSRLSSGTYIVHVYCVSGCEMTTTKFIKL